MEAALGLEISTLAWCLLTVFCAGFVRGYTGFGFSGLMVTTHALLLPPAEVVPAAFLLEIAASLHMLPFVWREVAWRKVAVLGVGAVLGMPMGLWVVTQLPILEVRLAVYTLVLGFTLLSLKGVQLHNEGGPGLIFGTGVVSGLANGLAAIGGLPVVLLFLATPMAVAASRATLVAYLFAGDVYAIAWSGSLDLLRPEILLRVLVFLIPLGFGVWLGHRRFVTTPPTSFRKFNLGLLLILSNFGLLRTIFL